MICFMDKTFCSSPGCQGKCGRKMTSEQRKDADKTWLPIMYSDFCDENGEVKQ